LAQERPLARKKSIDGAYDLAEVVRLYESGLSQKEVGLRVGLEQTSVGDVLRRAGVQSRRAGGPRRYSLDEGFFEATDTAEKAYWLGFLAADGGIMPHGSGVAVHLAERDLGHLRKLASALGSDAPIEKTPTGPALRLHSKRLAESLAPLGVVHRKSYLGTPWGGRPDLMPHYWRGLMDGDGHISKSQAYIALAGTQAVVTAFSVFAHEVCGTDAKPRPATRGAVWAFMVVGAKKVPVLLEAIYGLDGPVLERKAAAAAALIDRHPPRQPKMCRICGQPAVGRALCGLHWQRWRKFGDPEFPAAHRRDPLTGQFLRSSSGISKPSA
jgi:hypothetical protein